MDGENKLVGALYPGSAQLLLYEIKIIVFLVHITYAFFLLVHCVMLNSLRATVKVNHISVCLKINS